MNKKSDRHADDQPFVPSIQQRNTSVNASCNSLLRFDTIQEQDNGRSRRDKQWRENTSQPLCTTDTLNTDGRPIRRESPVRFPEDENRNSYRHSHSSTNKTELFPGNQLASSTSSCSRFPENTSLPGHPTAKPGFHSRFGSDGNISESGLEFAKFYFSKAKPKSGEQIYEVESYAGNSSSSSTTNRPAADLQKRLQVRTSDINLERRNSSVGPSSSGNRYSTTRLSSAHSESQETLNSPAENFNDLPDNNNSDVDGCKKSNPVKRKIIPSLEEEEEGLPSFPDWDRIRNPMQNENPIILKAGNYHYILNYVKIVCPRAVETFFRNYFALRTRFPSNPNVDENQSIDDVEKKKIKPDYVLKIAFGSRRLYFYYVVHVTINIPPNMVWYLYRTLSDGSQLYVMK